MTLCFKISKIDIKMTIHKLKNSILLYTLSF